MKTFTAFFLIALLGLSTALRTYSFLEDDGQGCAWVFNFPYKQVILNTLIVVPGTNSNVVGSGTECHTNGVAEGTISFYGTEVGADDDGKEESVTAKLSAAFTEDGIGAGAVFTDIKDASGQVILPGFKTEISYTYQEVLDLLSHKIEAQQRDTDAEEPLPEEAGPEEAVATSFRR